MKRKASVKHREIVVLQMTLHALENISYPGIWENAREGSYGPLTQEQIEGLRDDVYDRIDLMKLEIKARLRKIGAKP